MDKIQPLEQSKPKAHASDDVEAQRNEDKKDPSVSQTKDPVSNIVEPLTSTAPKSVAVPASVSGTLELLVQ